MKELKDPKFFILIAVGLVLTGIAGWEYIDFKSQEEYIAPPPTKDMPVITPPTSPPPSGATTEEETIVEKETSEPQAPVQTQPHTYTVSMQATAFSPSSLTINKGDTVRFVNNDTKDHWPASDVHPVHEIYPEFDPRAVIAPGEEWSFTFERVGEWGVHDHRSPYITGKIIVE